MQEHTSLTLEEYRRYGRQMILRGFGLPGQLKLKNAKVAVIGAGGLGCPSLQYLAGAGVGTIGIFDFDTVEASNLHRQVLHTTARVGEYKAESAKAALSSLNPHITIIPHTCPLLPSTALSLLAPYNLVLDCTDRPQTRYLVNDACVRLDVPLVSGAAIEWAGQWCVLGGYHQSGLPVPATESRGEDNNQKEFGRATWPALSVPTGSHGQTTPSPPTRNRRPCYRCLFPQPLTNTSGNDRSGTCEEEGVYGPIVGVVGVHMAAEAIKVVLGVDDPLPRLNLISMSPALTADPTGSGTSTPFRSIRVRGPSGKCKACGQGPGVVVGDDLEAVGYDEFCGVRKTDDRREGEDKAHSDDRIPGESTTPASVERISVQGLKDGFYGGRIPGGYVTSLDPVSPGRRIDREANHGKKVLVDVRAELEYGLCALPGSTNIPMENFLSDPIGRLRSISQTADLPSEVYFMCRRGNDSWISAQALRAALSESESEAGKEGERCRVKDVVGGVRAWSDKVDPTFPLY